MNPSQTFVTATIVLACLTVSPASAAVKAATTIVSCRESNSVVAVTICGSAEYRAMDREIAALADRAGAQLAPGGRSQLAESQARFVKQRSDCAWAGHNSAHPGAAIDECVRDRMEGRIRSLRYIIDHGGFEPPVDAAAR